MHAVAAPTTLKPKHEPVRRWSHTRCIDNVSDALPPSHPQKKIMKARISPTTVARTPRSECKRWRRQQTSNSTATQPEDGRTRAAFTMQAVAAPTNLKPKRKSARRRSHTRRIYSASGSGLRKIETQTRISPKNVAHAPHSQCKR